MATFLNRDKALLTVMLQCPDPETAIGRIRNAIPRGAEGFGLQVESLKNEFQTEEVFKKIIKEAASLPVYVTNYRMANNSGKSDEELSEGLLSLAESGATLVDVMGDLFSKHPEELTDNKDAIDKQIRLIEKIKSKGAEVLISSHLYKFAPAERVLEIALEQKRRGADIAKIVTSATCIEEEIENLRTTSLLSKELGIPFLFLSGGVCSAHRRIGHKYGNSLILCVYEHDALSTPMQPLLSVAKAVRDDMGF